MMLYIQFLLSTTKVTEAVIPKNYDPSEIGVTPEVMPRVQYKFTFERTRLRQLLILGTDVKEVVDVFCDDDTPIIEIDAWAVWRRDAEMPVLDSSMIDFLTKRLSTIQIMRFSGIYLGALTGANHILFGQEEAHHLTELHMRDCSGINYPLQFPRYAQNIRTLLIENISSVDITAEDLCSMLSGIQHLENLSLQLRIRDPFTNGPAHPPDFGLLLYPHRDTLKKLVLRFPGPPSTYGSINEAIKTCPCLTHLGFRSPVDGGNPMEVGTFTPDWLRARRHICVSLTMPPPYITIDLRRIICAIAMSAVFIYILTCHTGCNRPGSIGGARTGTGS
jgi:hypothetical protein